MSEKMYAFVGHAKISAGLKLGVDTYEYDPETAALKPVGNFVPELRVGAQFFDAKRNILYVVDEYWALNGQTAGGGQIAALDFDPKTGALTVRNIKRTFATNPSYITLDKTGKYLLVSHHCTDRFVTRLVKTDHGYDGEICYDRCVLELFEVLDDGSIGEMLDDYEIFGHDLEGMHTFPHLHCVIPDHKHDFFMVCDKGLDKIYSFRIDYENRKIMKASEFDAEPHTDPRYGVFHPAKPIFYSNCEAGPDINILRENEETGELTLIGRTPCVENLEKPYEPSDIVVHPNGKYLYVSIRTKDLISVLEIVDDETLILKETIPAEGVNPRGLLVSPDGRFLLAANMQSAAVNGFAINEDGTLSSIGRLAEGGFPGNIEIITFADKDQ